MTDEELIKALRDDRYDWLTDAAADRIEALSAALSEIIFAVDEEDE
jgi:hypothetical protein